MELSLIVELKELVGSSTNIPSLVFNLNNMVRANIDEGLDNHKLAKEAVFYKLEHYLEKTFKIARPFDFNVTMLKRQMRRQSLQEDVLIWESFVSTIKETGLNPFTFKQLVGFEILDPTTFIIRVNI